MNREVALISWRGEAKRSEERMELFRCSGEVNNRDVNVNVYQVRCWCVRHIVHARARETAREASCGSFKSERLYLPPCLIRSWICPFVIDVDLSIRDWWVRRGTNFHFIHKRRIGRIQPWHFLQSHLPLDYYYIHLKRVIDKKRFRQNFRATRTSCNHPASNPGRHKLKKYHNINVIIILHLAILNVM